MMREDVALTWQFCPGGKGAAALVLTLVRGLDEQYMLLVSQPRLSPDRNMHHATMS